MVYKYREVRGTFTALAPDTTDADEHPNIVPLSGSVVLTPIYKDGGISFSESGHFDQPQPKPAAIDPDGVLRSVVTDPATGAITRQALFLPVTVDERANQEWTYEASFPEVVRTDTGERVNIPAKQFAVEPGDGPLNLVAVATTRHPGMTITKGAPGAGLLDISAANGEITFSWDNGLTTTIDVPDAVPGPPGDDGTDGRPGPKGDPGDVRFEGIDPGITVGARAVVIGDQTIRTRAIDPIREGEDGQWRVMDSRGSVALEVDAQGRTHIYDPHFGGEPTTLHVFVAAGQSNMSGRGRPLEAPTSPRILQYGANRRVIEQAPVVLDMVDTPSGTSPASFFAHHYLAPQPSHVGVLLVPAARGGTSFKGDPGNPADGWTWTKGAAPSPDFALYERSVQQAQDAIAAAEAEGFHVILKGVLWHQGEGNNGMSTGGYAARLDTLIQDYRTDLEHPTLPFMVGQQAPEGMEVNPNKYNVDAAHQDTPYRTPFTGFAPATWDGHNDGDTTHFSTIGTKHLGDTYATAYVQAVGNTHQRTHADMDTGWVDVTDSMLVPALSGRVLVKRKGDAVQLVLDELRVEDTGTKSLIILPDGYRPFWTTRQDWYVPNAATPGGSVNITSAGYVVGYSLPGSEVALTASIRFDTEQPFPTP